MTQWLDVQTLSKVKDLPLVAKMLAQGFVHGIHASTQRGSGIEFSQYRSYEPGDELAKVDWKLFARSDKYFVREAEQESDTKVWFVLDCSQSMYQAVDDSEQDNRRASSGNTTINSSKFDYAKFLIATLAYLAQQQGDAVGLLMLREQHVGFFTCLVWRTPLAKTPDPNGAK